MFSRRVGLGPLADWCRMVSSSLKAGLTLMKALESTSKRGQSSIQQVSGRLLTHLQAGDSFADALRAEEKSFPPLFLALSDVATQTGHLPEVLRELESYFRFQLKLKKKFLAQISWPAIQLVLAIFIIALVIYILGLIEGSRGSTIDILGLGLKGGWGALVWLTFCFGSLGSLGLVYWAAKNVFSKAEWVDGLLLRVPALGRCLRSLALSRLCFSLHLTLGAGLSPLKAVPLSLAATDNGAFASLAPRMRKSLRKGASLTEIFEREPYFPPEFLDLLGSGEESGTVPEVMDRLAERYQEQSEIELQLLNTALGWVVWCSVAAMIIFFIFRIFSNYVRLLNEVGGT